MATKTVKATEVKATEVKEEVKVEAPKAAAKKAPAKKAPAKTAEVKTEVVVQFMGNEISTAVVEERVKAQFVAEGHKASTIKNVTVYVKPEEFAAYYVINGEFTGRVDLF